MTTPEDKLRVLRYDLAVLADKFVPLGREEKSVKLCCKAVAGDIGETLLELDTRMGWGE